MNSNCAGRCCIVRRSCISGALAGGGAASKGAGDLVPPSSAAECGAVGGIGDCFEADRGFRGMDRRREEHECENDCDCGGCFHWSLLSSLELSDRESISMSFITFQVLFERLFKLSRNCEHRVHCRTAASNCSDGGRGGNPCGQAALMFPGSSRDAKAAAFRVRLAFKCSFADSKRRDGDAALGSDRKDSADSFIEHAARLAKMQAARPLMRLRRGGGSTCD